jgi:GntR family transcriptional regulator
MFETRQSCSGRSTYGRDVDFSKLAPGAARPVYLQLADLIQAAIESGEYGPGNRLPSETDIHQETGLARATIRKAYRVLADEGAVTTVAQRGTYVLPI